MTDGGSECEGLIREVVRVWTCSAIQEGDLTSLKPRPQNRVTVQEQNKTKLHYN